MSQENVETFNRVIEAANRWDLEAALAELDPEIEWRPAVQVLLEGEAPVYRGHEGVRESFREAIEICAQIHYDFSEIQDLGDRLVATGTVRLRGRRSGVETESPLGYLVEFRNGKAIRARSYLDPADALEAAGLRE
jgi:ketosteroid isomerase-like protein